MNEKKENKYKIAKGDFCYDGCNLGIVVNNNLSSYADGPYEVVMLTGPDRGKVVPSGDFLLYVGTDRALTILNSFYNKPAIKAGDYVIKTYFPEIVYRVIDVCKEADLISCVRLTGPNAPGFANIILSNIKVLTPEAAASLLIRYYGK